MTRIPHAAVRLVRRSRVLTLGQKAVWQELVELGESGCWLTAAALGERVALSGPKVDEYRRLLLTAGLARRGVRRNEGRRGNPGWTWVALFPEELLPPSRSPSDRDLARLAPLLDAHLSRALGVELPTPSGGQIEPNYPPRRVDNYNSVAGGASLRGEGGRGEGAPHSPCVPQEHTPSSGEERGEQRSHHIPPVGAARSRERLPSSRERTREEFAQESEREAGGDVWESWAERCARHSNHQATEETR